QVVEWTLVDRRRVTAVPPHHWLLLHDDRPFRASLNRCDDGLQENVESIEVHDGHVACFAPKHFSRAMDLELHIERYGLANENVTAAVRFLAANPVFGGTLVKPPEDSLVLLTNG